MSCVSGDECHAEAGSLFGGGGGVELCHSAIRRSRCRAKSPVNGLLSNVSLPDRELASGELALEQCWMLGFATGLGWVDSFDGSLRSSGDDAADQSGDSSFGQ